MNGADLLIGGILVVLILMVLQKNIRKRRSGGGGCGSGGCPHCQLCNVTSEAQNRKSSGARWRGARKKEAGVK